ncbi:MAG: hypothetical protein H0U76_21245 [Ktedonobacteraceae bacterium]|nr:hypothetical protein [Ktedonobacteraceae bacterium]
MWTYIQIGTIADNCPFVKSIHGSGEPRRRNGFDIRSARLASPFLEVSSEVSERKIEGAGSERRPYKYAERASFLAYVHAYEASHAYGTGDLTISRRDEALILSTRKG